jgi:hypothetical protein
MAYKLTGAVKGRDLQPGQVAKIGGRWLRIVKWHEACGQDGIGFVIAAPHNRDPRLVTGASGLWRAIWADQDYPARDEPAPVWPHVTRELERRRAAYGE